MSDSYKSASYGDFGFGFGSGSSSGSGSGSDSCSGSGSDSDDPSDSGSGYSSRAGSRLPIPKTSILLIVCLLHQTKVCVCESVLQHAWGRPTGTFFSSNPVSAKEMKRK